MTFKCYQHCKIWLGLIYLLWLSSWVPGGTPVSIYILTWAFVLVKADSLTAMTSHTKAWISDELPTNPWPELCWMHIEGDKLIWPVAVPTRGLALCWAPLVELVHKQASNHCPIQRPGSKHACIHWLGEYLRQMFDAEKTQFFFFLGYFSCCSALTLDEGLSLCCRGGRRLDVSPPKWSTSEFAVLELNWVVVNTSIMGISGVGRVFAASTVTTGCQTGMTALVQ